jgi:hypothetical protein
MSPQFTLEHASRLLKDWMAQNPQKVAAKNAAIDRYRNYFAVDNLDNVTRDGFKDFLLLKNNQHWDKIYRHPEIYADMDRLHECLKLLLDKDEVVPIEARLDQIVPKIGPPFIKGFSRAVVTAILMCAHPDKYAVYNRKSDEALKLLSLNKAKAHESFGKRYVAINDACLDIAKSVSQPLHLVDTMFALMLDEAHGVEIGPDLHDESDEEFVFKNEAELEDFIIGNWDSTPLARTLGLRPHKATEEDEDETATQVRIDVGIIDILARDKNNNWVVIELKKGKGGPNAVGQILNYIGWIKKQHWAKGQETVRGVIIVGRSDDKIKCALSMTQDVELYTYDVRFELNKS